MSTPEAWGHVFDGYEWFSFVACGLFLFGAVATIWAGARLGAERFSPQSLGAPLIAGTVVSFLAEPQLTWLGAFTGGVLIPAGLIAAWGLEINERVLWPRRTHHLYTQPAVIRALTRSRHSRRLGRGLITLGVAFAGGTSSHAAIFIAFLLADGFSAAREERQLRVSGRHARMVKPFWDASTSLYFLIVVLIVASSGGVLDGSFTWVELEWTIQKSAPLLQALLATTITVAAIGGTAIGIALQIRSAGFGVELALAVLPRWAIGNRCHSRVSRRSTDRHTSWKVGHP